MAITAPRISCLDLDTFFVSVERVLEPSLEGRPVVVGGRPGQRGVVTACSYEVRRAGVRSGMSLAEAGRLCPDAVYLPTRHDTYGDYAARVREIAARYCPVIQVASIDELFMDFRGCERLYHRSGDADADGTILRTLRELTATIRRELGLPASVGIATSRSLAKVASGLAKPAGVLMVPAGQEAACLAPLPVRKLPGIGPVAETKLKAIGITHLGQLADAAIDRLRPALGGWAEDVKRRAAGLGSADIGRDRPAFREHDLAGDAVGSISNERTFREDVRDPTTLDRQLCALTERVCYRARKRGVVGRTITLKLRYADFETIARSRTVPASASELDFYPVVRQLLRANRKRSLPIRLLGIALSNLAPPEAQLSLFSGRAPLHTAVDDIRERHGFDALRLAEGLPKGLSKPAEKPAPAQRRRPKPR